MLMQVKTDDEHSPNKTSDLQAILDHELREGCYRRPVKRQALWLAKILTRERFTPYELTTALRTMCDLQHRINRAKL